MQGVRVRVWDGESVESSRPHLTYVGYWDVVTVLETQERLIWMSSGRLCIHGDDSFTGAEVASRHRRDMDHCLMAPMLVALGPFMPNCDVPCMKGDIRPGELSGVVELDSRGGGKVGLVEKCVIHNHKCRTN